MRVKKGVFFAKHEAGRTVKIYARRSIQWSGRVLALRFSFPSFSYHVSRKRRKMCTQIKKGYHRDVLLHSFRPFPPPPTFPEKKYIIAPFLKDAKKNCSNRPFPFSSSPLRICVGNGTKVRMTSSSSFPAGFYMGKHAILLMPLLLLLLLPRASAPAAKQGKMTRQKFLFSFSAVGGGIPTGPDADAFCLMD